MSGTGKKIADVAFKAGRAIDWEGMAKMLVSDEARKEFATLRRAFDEVNSTLQTKFSQITLLTCFLMMTYASFRQMTLLLLLSILTCLCHPTDLLLTPSAPLHLLQEPEPIDWEYYRKGIGSRLVDMYKQAYESIEVPKYVDNVTPQYKPKFDALLVELKEAEEKSLKESELLEKEIAEVQELKQKISTMTADEYFEKHPELKQKFDDEIRNDYWGY